MGHNYKVHIKTKKEAIRLEKVLKKNGFNFKAPRKKPLKKGGPFEKEIAKELSLWWTNNKRDDVFYKTAGSGSRFTSRKKQNKDTVNSCGDIGLLDPIGQKLLDNFSIEIKRGYSDDLDLLSIIDSNNKNNTMLKWIEKAKKEIEEANRPHFMIIFKRDRKNKAVCVSSKFIDHFFQDDDFLSKELSIYIKDEGFFIFDYDEFFEHFTFTKV